VILLEFVDLLIGALEVGALRRWIVAVVTGISLVGEMFDQCAARFAA